MILSTLFLRNTAPLPLGLAFAAAAFSFISAGAGIAAVASESPWVSSANSKARLITGALEMDGKPGLFAGIQLRMDQGWKTYWKNPGDSGVPPIFDWSGSKNLKSAEVLYPAPHRFVDGGGTAIGYDEEVVFPVKLTPEREDRPIALNLAFDYGLCKDLCIPNRVDLRLELPADAADTPGNALLLASSLARVPRMGGSDTLPRVESLDPALDGSKPRLVVNASFASGAKGTDLFVESKDVAVPVPKPVGPVTDGKQSFTVDFVSPADAAAIRGKPLSLTLVSEQGSSETAWTAE